MAGHGPAVKLGKDNASEWKSKLGIKLFFVYGLIYAGFVGLSAFKAELMQRIVLMGMNLAVVYGMGLIVLAIVMGVIYNHFCTKKEDELNNPEEAEEKKKEVAK